MARGWESKSVEEQQSQAREPDPPAPQMSEEDRRRASERESLRLARARILQQLTAASDERYKAQLQAALAEIEKKLGR